jgi:hypothetical protein
METSGLRSLKIMPTNLNGGKLNIHEFGLWLCPIVYTGPDRQEGDHQGVGHSTTLAWPGRKQHDISVEVDMARLETSRTLSIWEFPFLRGGLLAGREYYKIL